MSAFVRTQIDAVWIDGYVLQPSDLLDLGSKVHRQINGDKGGTWAPAAAITFTGSGFRVTGPTKIAYGGSLYVASGAVVLGVGDWPTFATGHALRSRRIVTNFADHISLVNDVVDAGALLDDNDDLIVSSAYDILDDYNTWVTTMAEGLGVRAFAAAIQKTGVGLLRRAPPLALSLRVQDASTLDRATVTFRVPTQRTSIPETMPSVRIVRFDAEGNMAVLKSTTPDSFGIAADAEGWATMPARASVDAWVLGGDAQSFVYICDQNHAVDVSQYTYWLEVRDENPGRFAVPGTSIDGYAIRERKTDVRLATTAPIGPLTGSISIDGFSTSTGDRILVKDEVDAYNNGIWIANDDITKSWKRAPDMSDASHVTQNMMVHVRIGTANSYSKWQIAEPKPVVVGGDINASPIYFEPITPKGNTFHAVAIDFTDIAEMRFQ